MLESLVSGFGGLLKGGFGPLFSCLDLTTSQGVYNTLVPDEQADRSTVTEDRADVVAHLAVVWVDVHRGRDGRASRAQPMPVIKVSRQP